MRTLEAVLSKHRWKFNVLLIEGRGNALGSGGKNPTFLDNDGDEYLARIKYWMQKNNVPQEGHITFAKNGSSGDAMTPWMVLHTLGHAFDMQELNYAIKRLITALSYDSTDPRIKSISHSLLLSRLFKFKSIVNNKLEDETELSRENCWRNFYGTGKYVTIK